MAGRRETDSEAKGGVFGRLWRRFGEVARRLGLVGDSDVRQALDEQEASVPRKKIGEILVERGKLAPSDVERVLEHQAAGRGAVRGPAGKKKAEARRRAKGRSDAKRSPRAKGRR